MIHWEALFYNILSWEPICYKNRAFFLLFFYIELRLIANFKVGEDSINLTGLLSDYKNSEFDLHEFIRIESSSTSTRFDLYLDRDGTGDHYAPTHFIQVNSNQKGLMLDDLLNQNSLIS